MEKARWSIFSFWACIGLMYFTTFCFYPKWEKAAGESTLGWDVSGYYWYLPSALIYKDFKHQNFGDSIIAKYKFTPSFEQSFIEKNSGNRVITYSSGMALTYLPFFAIAHFAAEPLDYPADGFSIPYQISLQIGSLLVAIIGLWYYRRLMLNYYNDKVVGTLLLLLVFGTNYLNYSAIDGSLTHNYLFTVYVFLLLATRNFYRERKTKYAVAIGLLCGLATLIRPSEIICIIIPLLWAMESISFTAIKERIKFLISEWKKLAVAAASAILVGSIQIMYWLYVTGKPFVYSYQEKGFSWLHPHFKDYIFSYRSGWVTYTPLIIFVFIGIIPFIKYGKNRVAILCFFALNLYIVSAWDIWWYGGTGGRAMIQSYPVLLFPLAAFLQFIFDRKVLKWTLLPLLVALAYFNIWFTYNAHAGQGLYDSEGMTKSWYWHVIYRYQVPTDYLKYKDTDELFEGMPQNMVLLHADNYENDSVAINHSQPALEGSLSNVLGPGDRFATTSSFAYHPSKKSWLRVQATFHCLYKEWTAWKMPQFIVRFSKGDTVIKDRMIRVHRFIDNNETKELYIDTKMPKDDFGSVKILFWNPGSEQTTVMDNLKVWSFDE